MKIVQIINSLAGGGAEILAVNLSVALAEITGNDVTLITLFGEKDSKGRELGEYLRENNVEYIKLYDRQFSKLKQLFEVNSLLHKLRPDIVHTHLMPSDLWGAICRINPFTRFKLIRTIHNNRIDQYPIFFHKILARIFDVNIACSLFVKDTYPIDAVKRRLNAVPNGIQLPRNYPFNFGNKKDLRISLGLPTDKTILINIGSMFLRDGILYKNQDLILKSVPLLGSELIVLFLGDGPQKDILIRQAEEQNVSNRVFFTGLVSDPLPYLAASDVFIMPSVNEGLPLSLLEGLCTGLPCILSDIPAFRPFQSNSVKLLNSLTPQDIVTTIGKIVDDLQRFKYDATINAVKARENYNIDKVAKKYAKYYN